jgi:hypothetical protein
VRLAAGFLAVMASSHVNLGVDGIIVDSAEDVMAKSMLLAVLVLFIQEQLQMMRWMYMQWVVLAADLAVA